MSQEQDRRSRWGRRLSRRAALAAGVRVGAGLVGLAGAAGVVSAGERGGRVRAEKRKSRTVTKRFRQFTPINIPEQGFAAPYPSTIRVSGFNASAKIQDVNVTLHTISHGYLHELDMLLQAPSGERCVFFSDAGGNTAEPGITLTFDDSSRNTFGSILDEVESGTYRPVNNEGNTDFAPNPEPLALARFKGLKPNGDWLLYVVDDRAGVLSNGSIKNGWSLQLTVKERR